MEGVEFEENNEMASFASRKIFNGPTVTKVTGMFIKLGLAKDEKHAKTLMVAIVIICLLAIVYINISTFAPSLLQPGQKPDTLSSVPSLTGYTYQEDVPLELRHDPRLQLQLRKLPTRN